jgi:hypothetical protein
MNIDNYISKFRSANAPVPIDEISLREFFEEVIQGKYEKEVRAIRSTNDPELKALMKKALPAVTISGLFTHRKAEGLVAHSGFICLDFDGKGNPEIRDWPAARADIGSVKEVVFCSLSVSGNGCFAVIPLAYPDQHQRQFEALKRDFPLIGFNVDKGCGDVPRLRFMSSDSGAIFNPGAEPYDRIYTPRPVTLPKFVDGRQTGDDEIYRRVRLWVDRNISFVDGQRHDYIKKLVGVMHRFGASENYTLNKCLEYQQEGFDAEEIESIVHSMYVKKQYFNIIH